MTNQQNQTRTKKREKNQTWSETKKNHALDTKLLTHKATAVKRAYPQDAPLTATVYLSQQKSHHNSQTKNQREREKKDEKFMSLLESLEVT